MNNMIQTCHSNLWNLAHASHLGPIPKHVYSLLLDRKCATMDNMYILGSCHEVWNCVVKK